MQWAAPLAADLRPDDAIECQAAGNGAALKGCVDCFRLSEWSRVAIDDDGRVVCAWGIVRVSLLSRSGIPWFLSTHRINQHRLEVARGSVQVVREMRQRYASLTNYVYKPYRTSQHWLRWLGAEIDDEVTMLGDKPFYAFRWGDAL